MNPQEYANLERIDRLHWYYRGKRAIVRHWIDRHAALRPQDLLIDAGMGTGSWLVEVSERCRVLGLDDHEESLLLATPKLAAVGGQALRTSLVRVDLPDEIAAVVTMLDVLEHLDDDAQGLREMVRLTRPGGLIVITVPALRWLWSDWDVALHHHRRYGHADLMRLFAPLEVDVLRCAYFNWAAVVPSWLIRKGRSVLGAKPGASRTEDWIPGRVLNQALYHLMVEPARWGWFRPPLGMSLLAVLRKPGPARSGAQARDVDPETASSSS